MAENFETLKSNFASPLWRMNNLYQIINEQGQGVPFRLRPAQELFLRNLHFYNIVLKARQLGFTTLIDLMALDMALFTPDFTAVIIAETKDKAADIFNAKIVYPYEHLDPALRRRICVRSHSADGELSFTNGSSVRVMVSARSGTCQFLHVSEYGPVCANSPAKAREIKTGSFPAVHAGGFVFVESTAMGAAGYFYDMVMLAKARSLSGAALGVQDFRLHFFPWWQNAEYAADPAGVTVPARLAAYFDDLYSRQGIELSEEQQAWYVRQEQLLHEDIWSEYPSYVDEAFKVAQDGSYYGRCFNDIHRTNRICRVPWEPELPVYTAWDLGVSDETSIWFAQIYGDEIRLIDYYENSGEGLPHYAGVLQQKGYRYARHFAPHDIAVRELGSGVSRLDTARKLGIKFDRIPTNADLAGGIENVRQMLTHCYFDEAATEQGRKCLEGYKKEWDDKHSVYKNHPLHDWASHGADSFRTLADAWAMGLCGERAVSGKIRTSGGLNRI